MQGVSSTCSPAVAGMALWRAQRDPAPRLCGDSRSPATVRGFGMSAPGGRLLRDVRPLRRQRDDESPLP